MRYVVKWMKENLLSEREEMFGEGDGVYVFFGFWDFCSNSGQRLISDDFRRPGILVLINDADWELEGELEYELRDRDEIVFISTLHGG